MIKKKTRRLHVPLEAIPVFLNDERMGLPWRVCKLGNVGYCEIAANELLDVKGIVREVPRRSVHVDIIELQLGTLLEQRRQRCHVWTVEQPHETPERLQF